MKKVILDFDVGFLIIVCMMGVCLCTYCLHVDDLIRPWTPIPRASFWLEFLLETRLSYQSLGGLMAFLEFLVPKLQPKCHKLI